MNGRNNNGFTLIELLIVMAIFGIVLAGTSQMLVSMLTASRQQSKIAETNIEGLVGLELMRQDLGKAGFGLPWNGLTTYTEVATGSGAPPPALQLNDAPNPPRGIVSVKNLTTAAVAGTGILANTDYLAIKAANVATNSASGKWTLLPPGGAPVLWTSSTSANDNLASTDWVIVLTPGSLNTEATAKTLVTSGAAFSAQCNQAALSSLASTMTTTGVVYGIDSRTDLSVLQMPFNRADYYVKQPATGLPQRCAPGTGILYKAVVDQKSGTLAEIPLLDCVADMKVLFRYDPNGFGSSQLTVTDDISGWTAQQIRDEVKEVRVYILAHEGQRDTNFVYPQNSICVGCDKGSAFGNTVNLTTDQQNYRWKTYTMVVQLDNLSTNLNP